jgi:tetratricopeptide (TPR) repeat protein
MFKKIVLYGLLAGCLGLGLGCSMLGKQPTQQIPLEVLINDGITYFYLGEYDAALATWQLCIERDPANAKIHNFIGVVYYKREEYQAAVEHFKKAIEIDPNFAETYNNLGYALFLLGNYKEAEGYFLKALNIDPYFTQASSNLKTVQRIISGSLDIRAYRLFQKSAGDENLGQNIKNYTEAIQIDPNYAEAHNNLGVMRYFNGEFDAAIKAFQDAIRLNPKYPEAHNNLGYLYDDQGKYEEAVAEYLKAIDNKNDYFDAYNNLGSTYFNMGSYDDAERVWKKIIELLPYNDEAKFHLQRLEELRKMETESAFGEDEAPAGGQNVPPDSSR